MFYRKIVFMVLLAVLSIGIVHTLAQEEEQVEQRPDLNFVWGVNENYTVDLMYVPPAVDVLYISVSEDGTVFIRHDGQVNPGISVVDIETQSIERIMEIGGAFNTPGIVGGPDDTAFVIHEYNILQVASDGQTELWGSYTGVAPLAYYDDYLIGRTADLRQVVRLYPDGEQELIADGFVNIFDLAVRDDGVIFVSDWETGNISRINLDGTVDTLVERVVYRDPLDMALDTDGTLYLNTVAQGLVRVNADTGTQTPVVNSYGTCTQHVADFEFYADGQVVMISPTWGEVVIRDIHTGVEEMVISNNGANTFALAMSPDDMLYFGAWGCGDTPARVIRMDAEGTQTTILEIGTRINDLSFLPDGTLYGLYQDDAGQEIFKLSPDSDTPDIISPRIGSVLSSMAVSPQDGLIYLADQHEILVYVIDDNGRELDRYTFTTPQPATQLMIDIDVNGNLFGYAAASETMFSGPRVERWVFQLDRLTGEGNEIWEYARAGCCVMANISTDADGALWWIVNPEFQIWYITPQGEKLRLADRLPIDPGAVVGDSQGNAYITSPGGIIRLRPINENAISTLPVEPMQAVCRVIAPDTVNLRSGAGTNFDRSGSMQAGGVAVVIGQTTSPDTHIWWQLEDETWVRSDIVQTDGPCEDVPQVEE